MIAFTLKGERYEFDEEHLPITDAMRIKEATGLTVRGFLTGLREYDPHAVVALVWLAKRRSGERVTFDDVVATNFDMLQDLEMEKPVEDEDEGLGPTGGAAAPVSLNGSTPTSPQPSTPSTPSTATGGSAASRSTSATPPPRSTR